jgi:hypothetical protein
MSYRDDFDRFARAADYYFGMGRADARELLADLSEQGFDPHRETLREWMEEQAAAEAEAEAEYAEAEAMEELAAGGGDDEGDAEYELDPYWGDEDVWLEEGAEYELSIDYTETT